MPWYHVVTLSAPQHINIFEPLHFFELVMLLHGYLRRRLFIYYKIHKSRIFAVTVI